MRRTGGWVGAADSLFLSLSFSLSLDRPRAFARISPLFFHPLSIFLREGTLHSGLALRILFGWSSRSGRSSPPALLVTPYADSRSIFDFPGESNDLLPNSVVKSRKIWNLGVTNSFAKKKIFGTSVSRLVFLVVFWLVLVKRAIFLFIPPPLTVVRSIREENWTNFCRGQLRISFYPIERFSTSSSSAEEGTRVLRNSYSTS